MKSFDEWYNDSKTEDFPNLCDAFKAGQQSKQAEVDGLQKHKEILLGELFLVSDAIQYHRVLNLLKGDQS